MPLFSPNSQANSNFRAFVVKVSQSKSLAPTPSRVGNVVVIATARSASPATIPLYLFASATSAQEISDQGYLVPEGLTDSQGLTTADLWLAQGSSTQLTANLTQAQGYQAEDPAQSILNPIRITKGQSIPPQIQELSDYSEFASFEQHLDVLAVSDYSDLHTALSLLYDNIDSYSVVVLTHAASQLYLQASNLPSPSLATMLCVASEEEAPTGLQLNDNIGIFLDSEHDGKAIMAITAMAQRQSDRPTPTNSITNPSYHGVTNPNHADLLAKDLYSFWVKSYQKTYPFALFCGGRQLYTILYEMYAMEAVMDAIANLTNQGNSLAQNLELMSATIASFLPMLSGSPSIKVATIESISQSDMVQGIITIEDIQFGFTGEHRQTRVHISAS